MKRIILRPSRWRYYAIVFIALVFSVSTIIVGPSAQALSGSQFNAGYIISDAKFFDSNSMTADQIETFLQLQGSSCTASSTAACIKNYTATTTSRAAAPNGCAAYSGANNEPAATIIYKVAQACGINPQVLLVTLQKEEGLITSASPSAGAYQVAMGYGCPDSSACNSTYYGFYNQVYSAAWQFRQYTYQPSNWRYKIGSVSIQYSPSSQCGSSVVNIINQSTANLYNYTPYQPDASALANLGHVGDSCSSYGNLNFWNYYNTWFGSSTGPINPFGSVDTLAPAPGGIHIAGWALDMDSNDPINVDVSVDGVETDVMASNYRGDIQALFNDGADHGFDIFIPVANPGPHSVCVSAINVGPGSNSTLACGTVDSFGGSPVGSLDAGSAGIDSILVAGWTLDPDTAESIPVQVSVDGAVVSTVTAGDYRGDVANLYPEYGPLHGFNDSVPASAGTHTVCVYGVDSAGTGSNTRLGCKNVTVAGGSPVGSLDAGSAGIDSILVAGWTLDPDTAESIPVQVSVDGAVVSTVTAGDYRGDVANLYPEYGPLHGFNDSVPASAGTHTVCVYGVDSAGTGSNTRLGCKNVTVAGGSPVGSLDAGSAGIDSILVAGWTLDPDTAESIPVQVSVDGAVVSTVTAGDYRGDVANLYPEYGPLHGFNDSVPASAGTHTVCVYGVDSAGTGSNTRLGCKNVTVAGGSPVGSADTISSTRGAISVAGWAIDPDTQLPISIRIVVDSSSSIFTANLWRADVGNDYPLYGPLHGFGNVVPANSGSHNVCIYAVNTGPGSDTLLRCSTVSVTP